MNNSPVVQTSHVPLNHGAMRERMELPNPTGSMHSIYSIYIYIYLPTFILKINHSCRWIYRSSHGSVMGTAFKKTFCETFAGGPISWCVKGALRLPESSGFPSYPPPLGHKPLKNPINLARLICAWWLWTWKDWNWPDWTQGSGCDGCHTLPRFSPTVNKALLRNY